MDRFEAKASVVQSLAREGAIALEVRTREGPIRVVGGDGDRIEIHAVKQARAGSRAEAQALLKQIKLDWRREGDRWLVQTSQGEAAVRYVTHPDPGVIDFYIAPAAGIEVVAFSRVVPNSAGAEYVFTQFQTPGMPDATFEAQVSALKEELMVLRALMHAQAACRS